MTEKQKTEVTNFIHRRFQDNCKWMDGNCYWFAHILCARFSFLSMYYCPVEGHFVAGAFGTYFDWLGEVKEDRHEILKHVTLLADIEKIDPPYYARLMRDCSN